MLTILGVVAYSALIYGIAILGVIVGRHIFVTAGGRIPAEGLRRIARLTGWLGVLYGVLAALYLAFAPIAAQDGEHPVRVPLPLEQSLLILAIHLPLYATAFLLVTTGRRFLLTLLVLFVVIPLNTLTMPSIGLVLVPATTLISLSTMFSWLTTGVTTR